MIRTVKMYQYKEIKIETKDGFRYEYIMDWFEEVVDSSEFNDQTKQNPDSMPYKTTVYYG
jgi:hypothetical protein